MVTTKYSEAFESQEAIFEDLRLRLEAAREEGARLAAAAYREEETASDSSSESESTCVPEEDAPSLADLRDLLDRYDAKLLEEHFESAPSVAELHHIIDADQSRRDRNELVVRRPSAGTQLTRMTQRRKESDKIWTSSLETTSDRRSYSFSGSGTFKKKVVRYEPRDEDQNVWCACNFLWAQQH